MGWFLLVLFGAGVVYYFYFSESAKEKTSRKEFADTMTGMFAQEFISGNISRNIKFRSERTTKSNSLLKSGKNILLMEVTNDQSFSNKEAEGLVIGFLSNEEIARTMHVLKFDAIWIQDKNGNHGAVKHL